MKTLFQVCPNLSTLKQTGSDKFNIGGTEERLEADYCSIFKQNRNRNLGEKRSNYCGPWKFSRVWVSH